MKEKQIEEMAIKLKKMIKEVIHDIEDYSWKDIAKELYKMILPKDSVVLTREEWKEYVDNENEAYYRGQHEAEVYYKNIQIPRERKETAEKCIRLIKKTYFTKEYLCEVIAKQFGVEIKE